MLLADRTVAELHAASAILPGGRQTDVRLTLNGGRIAKVESGTAATSNDERHDVLVPGGDRLDIRFQISTVTPSSVPWPVS